MLATGMRLLLCGPMRFAIHQVRGVADSLGRRVNTVDSIKPRDAIKLSAACTNAGPRLGCATSRG
jgi:hypothetical protein